MKVKGRWHIYEMEMWDKDYFNEEVQAYINRPFVQIAEFFFYLSNPTNFQSRALIDERIILSDGIRMYFLSLTL